MAYIDDVIGMARSRLKAIRDAQLTVNLLTKLGFTIHPEKIQVNPTQSIEALGTQVNSVKMQFLVSRSKRRSLLRKCFDTIVLHKQQECASPLCLRRNRYDLHAYTGRMFALLDCFFFFQLL